MAGNPMLARWSKLYKTPTRHELLVEPLVASFGRIYRFQHPIGNYFADFCMLEDHLVIEIDGASHKRPAQIAKDKERDLWMAARGYTTLRFWNDDVETVKGREKMRADIKSMLETSAVQGPVGEKLRAIRKAQGA